MFDSKKEYHAEIAPLVKELKTKCYALGIPMFFCAAVSDDGKNTEYKNEMLSAEIVRQPIAEDRIVKMVNVIMGYDVVMSSKPQEIDYVVDEGEEEEEIEGVVIHEEDDE